MFGRRVCAIALSLLFIGASTVLSAGGAEDSATKNATTENYPDGSKWPAASYDAVVGTALPLNAAAMMDAPAVCFACAELIQLDLPAGIDLLAGQASLVMSGGGAPSIRTVTGADAIEPVDEIDQAQREAMGLGGTAGPGSPKWFIDHALQYNGVRLAKQSSVLAIVGANGQLLYTRKRAMPSSVDGTMPTVSAEEAVQVARRDAGESFSSLDPECGDPQLEIWVDPDLKGKLTWTFNVTSPSVEKPEARQYWIAAVGDASIVSWESLIYDTHHGAVTGTLWENSPLHSTGSKTLGDVKVIRTGGGAGSLVTDPDGRYAFPTGSGNATLTASLSGPFCVIENKAGAVLKRSHTGGVVNPIDLNFGAAGEFQTAQVSAFYWTNVAHELTKDILGPGDLAKLPTRVNINASCNAYWNGSSINFYRAGGSCPNTAYSDVVLHEYGHGVDHRKGGIVDGGYSEGFGDALAIFGTRQSCLGRDFTGAGSCLRQATDVITWPPSSPQVHFVGRIYGGFTWELIQQLKNTYSEDGAYDIATRLVLAAAAGNPSSIPDAVKLSFLADDDDGDLTNGSPHFAELAAAADSRKIPRPIDPTPRMGYVWANKKLASNYTPSATYSYNSSGGKIEINRLGKGRYRVRFRGLGGKGKAGGNVQVTAYGGGNETAKVVGWSSSGSDFVVTVRCRNAKGKLVDTLYTVLVHWN